MIPIRISLDRELFEQADMVSRKRGVPVAELCRQILSEALGHYSKDSPWMAYVGSLEGRASDSRTVDEIVYGRPGR